VFDDDDNDVFLLRCDIDRRPAYARKPMNAKYMKNLFIFEKMIEVKIMSMKSFILARRGWFIGYSTEQPLTKRKSRRRSRHDKSLARMS
jgi:hypothetical protein